VAAGGGPKQITLAVFRAREGRAAALTAVAGRHEAVLKREGLLAEQPFRTFSSPGSPVVLQMFEWAAESPTRPAHSNPEVQRVWAELAAAAEFMPLGQLTAANLPEAGLIVAHPQANRAAEARSLLVQHAQALRRLGLATGPILTLQSVADGALLQVVEWRGDGARLYSSTSELQSMRTALSGVARLAEVSTLGENNCAFASFSLVSEN
jgi:hypothetical protein